jgi:CcmD family protein
MDNIEYLFAGFAVFWAGLFIYLLMLQMKIRALHREIDRLEERLAEPEGATRPAAGGRT